MLFAASSSHWITGKQEQQSWKFHPRFDGISWHTSFRDTCERFCSGHPSGLGNSSRNAGTIFQSLDLDRGDRDMEGHWSYTCCALASSDCRWIRRLRHFSLPRCPLEPWRRVRVPIAVRTRIAVRSKRWLLTRRFIRFSSDYGWRNREIVRRWRNCPQAVINYNWWGIYIPHLTDVAG